MPRKKTRGFTEVELEFMQIIWERGEATPDDIDAVLTSRGRSISIGSIRNVLAIMMEKGYLARRKEGKAYRYRAKVHKDQARKTAVADLLATMFEGSESQVVAALVENREVSPEERKKIHRILDSLEKEDRHES